MILIRKAGQHDAAGIARVNVASWRTTYAGIVPDTFLHNLNESQRARRWQEVLTEGNEVFVAERDQEMVGFIAGGAIRDPVEKCDAELYAIYLLQQAQRSKIGTGLLRELARTLLQSGFKSMDVWVLAKNPATEFYLRTGAHYAASKEIEIGGSRLLEEAYVWPDLDALSKIHGVSRS